ncbi:hypothetical protein C0991_002612 [Blastosporella zonata]|nr:hypothetical protein C0991_002612 [Blastosporella zonata]
MLLGMESEASHAPSIGKVVLPTPTKDWAENTLISIRDSANHNSLVLPSTPGPPVPGAYPHDGTVDYSKGIAFNEGYTRTQQNVKKAVLGASTTAKQYLPDSLASYFPVRHTGNTDTAVTRGNDHPLHNVIEDLETAHSSASEVAPSGIDTSFLTPHTNPEWEDDSIAHSNVSTKTLHGTPVSTRYSSQSSLTPPGIENGVMYSGSESADTPYRSPGSHDQSYPGGSTLKLGNNPVNTLTGRYPPFLGPVDSSRDESTSSKGLAEDGPEAGFSTMATNTGSSVKGEGSAQEFQVRILQSLTLLLKFSVVIQGGQQPTPNTQARTHPLAGPGAKWKGVPLEETYQKALDDNSDRQLNLGSGKNTSATKPAYEESMTQEVKRGIEGVKNHVVGGSDSTSAPRQRTSSVVVEKPSENHGKHRRSASDTGSAKNKSGSSASSSSSKPSRASWKDKLKGEIKVMSGKLSHDQAKVEEGRRLMGKA